jgi:hypothetical protein
MLEIGPNLLAVLLSLSAILALLAQGYVAARHTETVQRNGDAKAISAVVQATKEQLASADAPPVIRGP